MDFIVFDQDCTVVLNYTSLFDHDVVAYYYAIHEYLSRELLAIKRFFVDFNWVNFPRFHFGNEVLNNNGDEVSFNALAIETDREDSVLPEGNDEAVFITRHACVCFKFVILSLLALHESCILALSHEEFSRFAWILGIFARPY